MVDWIGHIQTGIFIAAAVVVIVVVVAVGSLLLVSGHGRVSVCGQGGGIGIGSRTVLHYSAPRFIFRLPAVHRSMVRTLIFTLVSFSSRTLTHTASRFDNQGPSQSLHACAQCSLLFLTYIHILPSFFPPPECTTRSYIPRTSHIIPPRTSHLST